MTFDPEASPPADQAPSPPAVDPPSAPPDRYCRVAQGFLYASGRLPPVRTQRPAAVLLLAVAAQQRFGIETARGSLSTGAAAVRPLVARRLLAQGVPVVSLNLHPVHAGFLRWRGIPGDGVLSLPRAAFAGHDAALAAMARGLPDRSCGQALCDALLATLHPLLPPVAADPPLRARLLQWLQAEPELELPELAQRLGVSYHRMSHCFSQALGVPYRHWRAYARAQRAAAQFKAARTLTGIAHEAGFADSAHLSHTWQRTYGLSPSFVRHDNSVQAIL